MKVDQKGHTTIIKDTQGDLTSFLAKVTHEHKSFEKQNIILDLLAYTNLAVARVNDFADLSKLHLKGKKSFVVVADCDDFNAVKNKLTVVPTLLEAHDMIEMEEIERDLGF
ncbi:ribonuclease Z [Flavobacterium sp. CYK-55]|uniref:ribonuclease Z n=1 Tax=Flavobacterium sp. CYK-55 TaxID=2835529 RepID=UPI001BCC428E|nr:ribonuclease Z [Flavobacterium sp. CYK-55]MBS7787715.1 ribonuclease Z [Flavobacterium sp. CYK-55]